MKSLFKKLKALRLYLICLMPICILKKKSNIYFTIKGRFILDSCCMSCKNWRFTNGSKGKCMHLKIWTEEDFFCKDFCNGIGFDNENYGKPVVINQVCTCTEVRQTPVINGKNICSICNKPVVQTCL